MWTFTSSGMHMPALIPLSVLAAGKTKEIREARERGWELQVRGRVRKHLTDWQALFMPEGTYSKVYASPGKDYNFRFYTTREAYGESLKQQSLAIDYTKFKDTAVSKPYHDLLMKVWSASTMLGRPYAGSRKKVTYPASRGRSFVGSSFFDDYYDEPERITLEEDTVPMVDLNDWFDDEDHLEHVRRKSIHDMTDDDLEELWNAQ
jgi:hypothetical protein